MKSIVVMAAAIFCSWISTAAAQEKIADKAGRTAERAGKFVEKTAKRTGKAVKRTAEKTDAWIRKQTQ